MRALVAVVIVSLSGAPAAGAACAGGCTPRVTAATEAPRAAAETGHEGPHHGPAPEVPATLVSAGPTVRDAGASDTRGACCAGDTAPAETILAGRIGGDLRVALAHVARAASPVAGEPMRPGTDHGPPGAPLVPRSPLALRM